MGDDFDKMLEELNPVMGKENFQKLSRIFDKLLPSL